MNDMAEIKANADRLVELTNQQSVIKAEIDEIKAWFEKIATDDLKDTKKKTIDYWGSNNSKVVVGNSETVKPVSMTMVKKLLGDVFEEFVKITKCMEYRKYRKAWRRVLYRSLQ